MKKIKIITFALLTVSLNLFAQTNNIVFKNLLAPDGTVLMTNAEFRCYSGSRIFFKNDDRYLAFHAADLSTNVLNALGTDAKKLDAKQAALDAANQRYKEEEAAWVAAQVAQRQRMIQQKAAASAAAAQAYKKQGDGSVLVRFQHLPIVSPYERDGL